MATEQFYATRDFKYGTRMMRAGDPVTMDGPTSRLYTALAAISAEKPKAARAAPAPVEEAVTETAPKPAPKRKAARRKKSA